MGLESKTESEGYRCVREIFDESLIRALVLENPQRGDPRN
jgi:hypothetical protein